MWNRGIITPIPKCSTSDPRDPLSYRGITLAPFAYKVFCGILNDRLVKWPDEREIIKDEQNGFMKGRSTVDHINTITSIIETRKKCKLSTYVAFRDRPFNLQKGGFMGFFRSEFFFRTTRELEYLFFLSCKAHIFFLSRI